MQRQVYGVDPKTGKPGWFYIDCGKARVRDLRGTDLVARDGKTGDNTGRKVTR